MSRASTMLLTTANTISPWFSFRPWAATDSSRAHRGMKSRLPAQLAQQDTGHTAL